MILLLLASLLCLVGAEPVVDSLATQVEQRQAGTANGIAEYNSFCRTCPNTLCPHLESPAGGETYTFTCWTYGDRINDTSLWLKTTKDCYFSEYELVEYEGDYREDMEFCGEVPMEVTVQPATVQYLSECKWGYYTNDESITYYGRDAEVHLLCWAEGENVMGDVYWYKTLDNCCISGSGLLETPDRSKLDNCGPSYGPRPDENVAPLEPPGTLPPIPSTNRRSVGVGDDQEENRALSRRWLQPGKIGEEYAPCYECPSSLPDSPCGVVAIYEYNQTVVNQCTYANTEGRWMLTVDWCYVNGTDFWVPPWDHYRYPSCTYWDLPSLQVPEAPADAVDAA